MIIVDSIAKFLEANGLENDNTKIYRHQMPDTPDNAMCVYEYPNAAPSFSHSGMDWERQGIQIVARSKSYETAREKIESAFVALRSLTNFPYDGKFFLRVEPNQSPFPLGPADSQGRYRIAVNFDVAVRA